MKINESSLDYRQVISNGLTTYLTDQLDKFGFYNRDIADLSFIQEDPITYSQAFTVKFLLELGEYAEDVYEDELDNCKVFDYFLADSIGKYLEVNSGKWYIDFGIQDVDFTDVTCQINKDNLVVKFKLYIKFE